MNVEIRVSSRTLAIPTNGVFSATERGYLVQELVRIDRTLKNHDDPKITFAMSDEHIQRDIARREELCGQLGLPRDETKREKVIQGYDGYFTKVGLPYSKINSSKKYEK